MLASLLRIILLTATLKILERGLDKGPIIFYLADNIVPEADVEIDEWLHSYYLAGGIAAFAGLICSTIWFYFGINYSGGSGIGVTHTILWIVSAIASFLIAFLVIDSAQEGTGLSFFFVGFLAPVGYYLNSLINSAEAVKFIPPTGVCQEFCVNRFNKQHRIAA